MKDIHGIRPPVQVGFDPILFKIILMVSAAVLVAALVFFLVKKFWKRKKHSKDQKALPQPLAPYEAAAKALDLLFQRQMDDPRAFYFDLTIVLRQYIGRSFGINAIEMTSQEFIRSLKTLDLDKGIKKEMAEFQNISDPFKYAGVVPQKDRVKKDLLLIKAIIDQIEKDLTKQAELLSEKQAEKQAEKQKERA
ncbi:hypothetical protein [Desulfobacula toluolica]|uniref:Conserved uncharacterized protein n=1 Tax=Desulfobacula toluolica (strain DSM 7467 / Tol2) TaxID=651182 RepID=K0NEY9_DESTT|nr:hypothetical protein [Desulfobacula toluolica]CCK79706.1 conserved uncharacterized protein [Desulfobacula toluolica Tol2]